MCYIANAVKQSNNMNTNNPYQLKNSDFTYKIDVVCPGCGKRALVSGLRPDEHITQNEARIRFSCTHCGYSIRYADTAKVTAFVNSKGIPVQTRVLYMNQPQDPYFCIDLWYRIETTWGLLWAYNLEHLEVIESYLSDKLRSRNGIPMQNNSIASRLPQWAKDGNHREVLMKLIQRVK